MPPSAKIESLISENFVLFTFKAIHTKLNKNNEEKKEAIGFPILMTSPSMRNLSPIIQILRNTAPSKPEMVFIFIANTQPN